MARIAVLASGGVDSSVALCRLADEGRHSLTAYYLKIWLEDELAFLGSCPWEEDLSHLRKICDSLDVALEVVPLQREYFSTVVTYAIEELEAGRTPSPDVICNRSIKFRAFPDHVQRSAGKIASGHYARTIRRGGMTRLLRGTDPIKDQTYFLSQLDQQQVARCVFPIGHLTKAEVREEARLRGLPNCDRPDSQGICFLGRIPYDAFVEFHLGKRVGEIREAASGRLLGEHRGHWFHTIGQRRGLGLAGGPWYVVAKDTDLNRVLVTHGDELEVFRRGTLRLLHPHWIAAPPSSNDLLARIRHGERLIPCTANSADGGGLEVRLAEPDPGIAPGQFAVLYDGQECLGGGAIG
jgi:tRNA-specific 2-thiouridylase